MIANKGISFFIQSEMCLIVQLIIAIILQSLNLRITFGFWIGFVVLFIIDFTYCRQNKNLLVTTSWASFLILVGWASVDDDPQFHQNDKIMLLLVFTMLVRVGLLVVVDSVELRVELVVKLFFILLIYCKC